MSTPRHFCLAVNPHSTRYVMRVGHRRFLELYDGEAAAIREMVAPGALHAMKMAAVIIEGEVQMRGSAGLPQYLAVVTTTLDLLKTAIAETEAVKP